MTFFTGVGVVEAALDNLPQLNFAPTTSSEVVTTYGVVTVGEYDTASVVKDALVIAPGSTGFVSNFAYQLSKHRCYERELDGLADLVAY